MRGPGDGIGLVRPAQPDHQRTSRVQRNRSVFRREDLISARPRGCFVYESLELWKRPALYGSPERNFSGCAVCENIEGRLVEKAPFLSARPLRPPGSSNGGYSRVRAMGLYVCGPLRMRM